MMYPSGNLTIDSSNIRAGINTIGHGFAVGPTISASLQLVISNSDFYHGPPQTPRIEVVHGTRTRAAMADAVAAILARRSVTSVEVVVPKVSQGMGRPQSMVRLDMEVNAPDSDNLAVLLNDVSRATADVDLTIAKWRCLVDGGH